MSDDILFQDNHYDLSITPKLLSYRARTFPIHSIAKVAAIEYPFEFISMLVNATIFFIGLLIIFTFSWWSILGLIMVGIGGFNVKDIFTKKYIVMVEFASGEDLSLTMKSKDIAITCRDALHQALSLN